VRSVFIDRVAASNPESANLNADMEVVEVEGLKLCDCRENSAHSRAGYTLFIRYGNSHIGLAVAAYALSRVGNNSAEFVDVEHFGLSGHLLACLEAVICPQGELDGQHDRNDSQRPVNPFTHHHHLE